MFVSFGSSSGRAATCCSATCTAISWAGCTRRSWCDDARLVSAASAIISILSTGKSKDQASVVEVAGRQRTLAERYVEQVLLVQDGSAADPARTGVLLAQSAKALLDGGKVPSVEGDDDE